MTNEWIFKPCSRITSAFAFTSKFKNGLHGNKWPHPHPTFAFSRTGRQRNANVGITCEWTFTLSTTEFSMPSGSSSTAVSRHCSNLDILCTGIPNDCTNSNSWPGSKSCKAEQLKKKKIQYLDFTFVSTSLKDLVFDLSPFDIDGKF